MTLKRIVEQSDTPAGRVFDLAIQFLIVVSLVSVVIESLPNLSPSTQRFFAVLEVVVIVLFTVEYLLRLAVADNRLRFAVSFYGLLDLVAILPFYLATGVDLRTVRIVRLLRLVRAFKLLRYGPALDRFRRAFVLAREEIILVIFVSFAMLYLAAVGLYVFERTAQPDVFGSILQSLWWAVTTLTIGYGSGYPVTLGGKLFTGMLLVLGVGLVAAPAGLIASALTEIRREDADARGP